MKGHRHYEERLPIYAAGTLDRATRDEMDRHLAQCSTCRRELSLWRSVALEIERANRSITPPEGLVEAALTRLGAEPNGTNSLRRSWSLLWAQGRLIPREIWPAGGTLIALGVMISFLAGESKVLQFLIPLVAAGSFATVHGPEHDPGMELALATPTSPWKILLARLTVVSAYNFLLATLASGILLVWFRTTLLPSAAFGWLAPLTFLSALSLVLSMRFGTTNALTITGGLWLLRSILPPVFESVTMVSPTVRALGQSYLEFWRTPELLLALAPILFGCALLSAGRPIRTPSVGNS